MQQTAPPPGLGLYIKLWPCLALHDVAFAGIVVACARDDGLAEPSSPSGQNGRPRGLQVPTTQLAKMSIDPKFVELTADVLGMIL